MEYFKTLDILKSLEYNALMVLVKKEIEKVNKLHHSTDTNLYWAVMRDATIALCEMFGLKPNLKVRELFLDAATVNFSSKITIEVKYNLHKDKTPVWDGFNSHIVAVIAKTRLELDKYNPVILTKNIVR